MPFPLGASYPDLTDSWRAAEECGFQAVWTIDHMTPTEKLRPSWEASGLLVAMAASTRSIDVGVLVFDVMLRHPLVLAGSVAVAQAQSGGRARVGLGIGDAFSKADHDAMGIGFPRVAERVRHLDATITALGHAIAEAGVTPPELIVGGRSRTMLEAAVRHRAGWNLFTQDPDVFEVAALELEQLEAGMGAARLPRSVYLFVDRLKGDPRDALREFEAGGAGEAMLVVMRPTRQAVFDLARRVL